MLWHEQSWPKIDKLDKNLPVVIPLGSCEQHGRHLPLFVDTIQVDAIAQEVEKRLGDDIVLTPTFWLGCSHHHKDFPGTISLLPSLYSQVIQSITQSVLRAGFRRIFFLNGHGGNEIPGSHALTELIGRDDQADAAYLALASWWKVGCHGLKPENHAMTTPNLTHACEYETSFMLALRKDLVDMQAVVEDQPVLQNDWYAFETGGRVNVFRRFARFTSPGNMGRPSQATQEKGQSMFQAVTDEVVAFLKSFATWPELPKIGPTTK